MQLVRCEDRQTSSRTPDDGMLNFRTTFGCFRCCMVSIVKSVHWRVCLSMEVDDVQVQINENHKKSIELRVELVPDPWRELPDRLLIWSQLSRLAAKLRCYARNLKVLLWCLPRFRQVPSRIPGASLDKQIAAAWHHHLAKPYKNKSNMFSMILFNAHCSNKNAGRIRRCSDVSEPIRRAMWWAKRRI